jgi:hypothetical protein
MKIVLAGDGGVGKTAIRERYLGRGFQSKYMMTIGADFALKKPPLMVIQSNSRFGISLDNNDLMQYVASITLDV